MNDSNQDTTEMPAPFPTGAPATGAVGLSIVVPVYRGADTVGLLVEAVSEILSVSREQIQETPDIRSEMARQSITGVIPIENGMTRVIDLGAVLHPSNRAVA